MAGRRGPDDGAAWFAVSRTVALLAVAVLSLLALGTVAALVVDAVEITAPQITSSQDTCEQRHPNIFLSVPGPDLAACQWLRAMSRNFARTLLLQVDETGSGAFEATATITTVLADPLVTMVQRGDGQDANAFASAVVGYIAAGENTFTWSAPTVAMNSAGTAAVISATGQPSGQPPIPGSVQLSVGASLPATVEVSTQNRVIAAVSDDGGTVASESAHSLSADNVSGALRISLQPGSAQPPPGPPGPAGARWVARVASTAWAMLSGFAGMLVPAGAWIALFLASRMGAFGVAGRGPVWRHMERILGAVVIAHLVISASSQITATEDNLGSSLFSSSWPERLSRAMADARLWSPNGFPAVDGGLVLLIAFALLTADWDPGERERSPSRRRPIAVAAALTTGAAAVGGYVALAYANIAPVVRYAVLPDGRVERTTSASRPPLAVELPVVTVCALLVIFLAAVWICGKTAGSPKTAGFPKTRSAIGASALVAAAALIGAAIAAAIVYRGNPLSVDAFTLWGAGSLVTLTVPVILAASLVRPRPPMPSVPHAGPRPRAALAKRLVGLTGLVLAVALAGGLPFYVIPYLVTRGFADGSSWQLSGTTVLIACLVVAAVLAFAAGAASRPWRAASFLNRRYWIVPLIAILTVAATITAYGGYAPVALRWGVLVIAGTFMGMAVMRLTVAAAGPLRSPAKRMPHLMAAILIAAVIAVPWGELGHDFLIGWWDLLTYANRIDGILPLVLVAAGVTALRRLGLVPVRDETTLSGHRGLGIAAWVVALSGSYTVGGTANLADAAALAAAALAAWLLMPRDQVRRASVIAGQPEQEAAAAVKRAVETGVARRTLPGLAKTMRDEVAAGKTDFAQAQEKVAALEERAAFAKSPSALTGRRTTLTVPGDELAFGSFISLRPWERARWGMGYAIIAGAPWVLLGLAGANVPLNAPEGYPELALISAVAPLVLRWVGYGLLFGYFFPLLRGRTGLGKSISFFASATAPSILSTLTSPHPGGHQWHSPALLVVQLLIFALTIGLLADLAVLRKNGFTVGRLVDLHSLWTVSAWASSIAVAVATGIATIILAGLQPFVIGVITPSPPTTPPASVTHP